MESALYGIHALVVFVSEISLLRFQKHVLNFRTQARSINESIHLYTVEFIGDKLHKDITTYTTFFNLRSNNIFI